MSNDRRRTPTLDRLDRRAAPSGLVQAVPLETYDVNAGVLGSWGHPPAPTLPPSMTQPPLVMSGPPPSLWPTAEPPKTTWDRALDLILGDPDRIGL